MASMTPRELGYRMPAEWEAHEATWLAWPKNRETFFEKLPQAEEAYLRMIAALAANEKVHLLVDDDGAKQQVLKRLAEEQCSTENVLIHELPTVDVWMRDYAPVFVKRGSEVAANCFSFNAWGNKYDDLRQDAGVTRKIARLLGMRCFEPGIVLEGGSIDVNGAGACITTEQCLLNANRNPQLSRRQIEQALRDYLGVERVVWLKRGIAGDDTDGHVDDIARFVGKNAVACAVESDKSDENYAALAENKRILLDEGFEVIALPMPKRVVSPWGRLPASYANFYVANGVVLVPTYGCTNDAKALETLRALFPKREIVAINCEALLWGFGALHCVTMQQPAAD